MCLKNTEGHEACLLYGWCRRAERSADDTNYVQTDFAPAASVLADCKGVVKGTFEDPSQASAACQPQVAQGKFGCSLLKRCWH